jgi:hypothetical protein
MASCWVQPLFGIGNDGLARSFGADVRFDSVNVDIRVSTGFQLKLRIPL